MHHKVTPQYVDEYPPKASLAKDVYRPFPTLPSSFSPETPNVEDPVTLVTESLSGLSAALASGDVSQVQACFLTAQAYWRDVVAFTWHLRTFFDGPAIAPALVQLAKARGGGQGNFHFELDAKSVKDVTPKPSLRWIEGLFTFETQSPAAKCGGRVTLFPEQKSGDEIVWKIWALSTWVDDLVASPQNMDALKAPRRKVEEEGDAFETDVLILGGGNA